MCSIIYALVMKVCICINMQVYIYTYSVCKFAGNAVRVDAVPHVVSHLLVWFRPLSQSCRKSTPEQSLTKNSKNKERSNRKKGTER